MDDVIFWVGLIVFDLVALGSVMAVAVMALSSGGGLLGGFVPPADEEH